MEIEFIKQQKLDHISSLDEIELFNCEDGHMNGHYTVAQVDSETGDVTLVGKGRQEGVITTICLGGDE